MLRKFSDAVDTPLTYNQCTLLVVGALVVILSLFVGAYWYHRTGKPVLYDGAVERDRLDVVFTPSGQAIRASMANHPPPGSPSEQN